MTDGKTNIETKEFQAEVKKLLDIVIHSLYTERDIFVRELISNAADALEKFRHQSLLEAEVFDSHVPLEISIDVDDEAHTLTITDTGIGMTREELEHNLGTIAHSGSKTFLSELAEAAKKDVSLIGQFGVGFYSAFMAANKVRVLSRSYHPDADGHEWSSDGTGSYTLAPAEGIRRGTKIIIELKDDAHEYASMRPLKSWFTMPAAIWLRAALAVHKNKTFSLSFCSIAAPIITINPDSKMPGEVVVQRLQNLSGTYFTTAC